MSPARASAFPPKRVSVLRRSSYNIKCQVGAFASAPLDGQSSKENPVSQKMFKAKITPAAGGNPIEVTVPANDPFQATAIIESQYGPVKTWWKRPTQIR